jgi:hypothetical protein
MVALGKHHFDDRGARVNQFIGLCLHDHTFAHRFHAGWTRHAVDSAGADPARAERRLDVLEVAQAWNEDAILTRDLHEVASCLCFDLLTIDSDRDSLARLPGSIDSL